MGTQRIVEWRKIMTHHKGQHRFLTDEELQIVETYILLNCKNQNHIFSKFSFNLYVYAFYNYISYVIN